jgi:ATP-dependent protease ClpP protease subunit
VRINSIGGSVFEGFAIFNALARHSAQIVVEIDALAASAASLVAMAGDRIRIASNAMMMIHRAWVIVAGNKRELQHVIGILERVDDNLADTYAARTKKPKAKIEQLLDAETWFTAEEAVKEGFADQITAAVNASAYVPAGRFQNTPRRFLESRPGASVERVREQLSEMRERLLLNR